MTVSVDNWNVLENVCWYVRIADSGAALSVELYLSLADAAAGTNRQASGATEGYGSGLDVVLTADAGAEVNFFQSAYSWHLQVSGQSGDDTKILRVNMFVDLDEIVHPLYRDADLLSMRATAEIDAHTHASIAVTLTLGTHLPGLDVGDIIRVNSTRRSMSDLAQVDAHTITGDADSVISDIVARRYLELKR